MIKNKLAIIILAAGKGTRMKSSLAKVLHDVAGAPMLSYTLDLAGKFDPEKLILVVGSGSGEIIEKYRNRDLIFCEQKEQRGTADAVLAAKSALDGWQGNILILCGDMPNIKYETIQQFMEKSADKSGKPCFITVKMPEPQGYGRVVRDNCGNVIKIVEEKDADDRVKNIDEVNTGVYYCNSEILFERLKGVDNKNAQKEYYLTDIVENGSFGWRAGDYKEFVGINDRLALTKLSKHIWLERAENFAKAGVTFIDTGSVYIDPGVSIEPDTVIYPNVFLKGSTVVSKRSVIYPGCRIEDSFIGVNCIIKDNSVIEESTVYEDCVVGPMARLRPKTVLRGNNRIGNFVELKNADMGVDSKAAHLSYLGDCTLGKDVNIGCGTITCNYDGFNKHHTIIGDNVFIGSDVQLVAPIIVGNDSIIGAGSTITRNVNENELAVCRADQVNYKNKAEIYRKIKRKGK